MHLQVLVQSLQKIDLKTYSSADSYSDCSSKSGSLEICNFSSCEDGKLSVRSSVLLFCFLALLAKANLSFLPLTSAVVELETFELEIRPLLTILESPFLTCLVKLVCLSFTA